MKKLALATLIIALTFSVALPVNAQTTIKCAVDDTLFVAYDFENLDQAVFELAKIQFNAETIPNIIVKNLEQTDQTLVRFGFGSQPLVFDNDTNTIHTSFFLSGSDIISFSVNRTTMERTYRVKTDWRKIQVNLTSNFSIDLAQSLAKPVAEWQKPNETTFHYETEQQDTLNIIFDIILPSSASNVQVQADTITYDMPPRLEDQLLNSPFLILGALAIGLIIILIYRKVR